MWPAIISWGSETMIFQSKIDRALKKLHEESDAKAAERGAGHIPEHDAKDGGGADEWEREAPMLEKNDFLAMVLAALITFVPAALLVLGVLAAAAYFLFMR